LRATDFTRFSTSRCATNAQRFSVRAFQKRMQAEVAEVRT